MRLSFLRDHASLSFTFLVSGALPASRGSHEGHPVQSDISPRERLKIPSDSRRGSTVVYGPERSQKAQAGCRLPVGSSGSVGAAWPSKTWTRWPRRVPAAVCAGSRGRAGTRLRPGEGWPEDTGQGKSTSGGRGGRGPAGRRSRRKWLAPGRGPDLSQDTERKTQPRHCAPKPGKKETKTTTRRADPPEPIPVGEQFKVLPARQVLRWSEPGDLSHPGREVSVCRPERWAEASQTFRRGKCTALRVSLQAPLSSGQRHLNVFGRAFTFLKSLHVYFYTCSASKTHPS